MPTYYLRNKWEAVAVRQHRTGQFVSYHCQGHKESHLGIMDDFGNLVSGIA